MEDSDSFLDDSALMSIDLGALTQQAAAKAQPAPSGDPAQARIRELEQQLRYKTAEATNLRSNVGEVRPPLHRCPSCYLAPGLGCSCRTGCRRNRAEPPPSRQAR